MKSGLPSLSMSIGRDVDRAVARVDHLRRERRRLPVGGPVLEQRDVAGGAPAEAADDHVEVAVAVEVGGTRVRRASQLRRQRDRDVRAVGAAPQPVDGAVAVVGGLERAQVGDEEVAAAVLVEVDRLDVGGVAQPGDRLQRVGVLGEAEQHRAGPHLAGQDVETLVAVHVEQPHVRDGDGAGRRGAGTARFSNGTGSRLTAGQASGSGSFSGALPS